jgi:hypothetical protein
MPSSIGVVIDGGVTKTAPVLASFLGPAPELELVMVSHLTMLENVLAKPKIDDFWFQRLSAFAGLVREGGATNR